MRCGYQIIPVSKGASVPTYELAAWGLRCGLVPEQLLSALGSYHILDLSILERSNFKTYENLDMSLNSDGCALWLWLVDVFVW